ncbi:MAG: hypothetical protein JNK29_10385, partial [Anaerolineales bacterium]|nr:hypothetical protein [Anaerolineales bacterium]
ERFDVQPLEIFAGEQVQISWAVIGKPTITSLPDPLLASGQRVVFPRETTTYVLQVTNAAGQTVQQEVQVIVKPVPTASPTITPSPTPAPPVVDIFQANGLEVVEVTSGDRVRLAWSVSGNVTGIEIKSLSTSEQYFPAEKQGSLLTQPLTENTQYTLVASNGTAKSNPPKQVNVIIKPPPPSVSIEAIIDATSQRLTDVNAAADVYTFDAPVGARVRVTWTNTAGTNTKRVIFDGQEYLPSASAIITIPRQSLYTLSLVAQGDNPPPLDRTGYTLEFRPQLAVPVPPANVRPVPDIPPADLLVTPPITITWDYPGDVTAIRGFAVYRADPGGPLLQVTGVLTVGQTIFVDSGTNGVNLAPPGLCGVAYSVVAVYRDIFDVDQQTPTSAASWQNPFCP